MAELRRVINPEGIPPHPESFAGRQPAQIPRLTMPSYRQTPLCEFNKNQALLSWAFPTLFPNGVAEYTTPRPRAIPYGCYIKQLLLYGDGRFQRHPRFRYVAFNTICRMQVNKRASFFVNRLNPAHKDVTIEELQEAFRDHSEEAWAIVSSVTRYTGTLRGTRPYWRKRHNMLDSMVRQLGCPHLFITFSAADQHWDSLLRHMPQYQDPISRVEGCRARSTHAHCAPGSARVSSDCRLSLLSTHGIDGTRGSTGQVQPCGLLEPV